MTQAGPLHFQQHRSQPQRELRSPLSGIGRPTALPATPLTTTKGTVLAPVWRRQAHFNSSNTAHDHKGYCACPYVTQAGPLHFQQHRSQPQRELRSPLSGVGRPTALSATPLTTTKGTVLAPVWRRQACSTFSKDAHYHGHCTRSCLTQTRRCPVYFKHRRSRPQALP